MMFAEAVYGDVMHVVSLTVRVVPVVSFAVSGWELRRVRGREVILAG